MYLCGLLGFAAQSAFLLVSVSALERPHEHVKRDLESLKAEYDYIVVGGGTSGLVVATRLSEDPESVNTIMTEGHSEDANAVW